MKIVFLDKKTLGNDISIDQFIQFGEVISYDTTNEEETIQNISNADIVITNKVIIDKNVIDNCNIKLICVAATGMNNIDLDYAQQKSIEVKNVSGYSTASVAQLTLSFVLQFVQKINIYDVYGKASWKYSKIFTNLDHPFYELAGKNWGIIGLGEIGREVAKIADAFGCKVSYYSTSGKNKNTIYQQKELEELLQTSDIITIHSPLNENTINLINKSNIQKIKNGAILLNLGRGGIVNEQDIANAMNENKDIYFGTDVVTKEPIEKESPLLQIHNTDRLIITPHIAWASKEARVRLVEGIIHNIENFLK